jgi:hypothetical protein
MKLSLLPLITVLLLTGVASSEERLVTLEAKKEIIITGYTRKHKSMTISSEVSGRTLRVNYDIGDVIGEKPFIEIDTTFVDFGIDSTETAIDKLEVSLKMADSRVEYLEGEFKRIDTLHKGDRATGVRRDAAAQELEQARLERDAMMLELDGLLTKLDELTEQKARHGIYLPSGWVLTWRTVEAGEVVSPGLPLGRASDFRKLVVPLSVSADEFDAIAALPEEFPSTVEGTPVRARVNRVNPEFDEATRKQNIEILITQYEGPRAGGLRFSLPVGVRTEGILVPRAAITERYKNPRVKVKATGEVVPILITGESGDYVIAAEEPRLSPGTELSPLK